MQPFLAHFTKLVSRMKDWQFCEILTLKHVCVQKNCMHVTLFKIVSAFPAISPSQSIHKWRLKHVKASRTSSSFFRYKSMENQEFYSKEQKYTSSWFWNLYFGGISPEPLNRRDTIATTKCGVRKRASHVSIYSWRGPYGWTNFWPLPPRLAENNLPTPNLGLFQGQVWASAPIRRKTFWLEN